EAIALLRRGGDPEAAAKLAMALRDYGRAGEAYLDARKPREAAEAWLQGQLPVHAAVALTHAGEHAQALQLLLSIDVRSPHYRDACLRAAPLALALKRTDEACRRFFAPFLATPHADAESRQRVQALAALLDVVAAPAAQAPNVPAHDGTKVLGAPPPTAANDGADKTGVITKAEGKRPLDTSRDREPDSGVSSTRVTGKRADVDEGPRADPSVIFTPGVQVARRYRLERLLGEGGMAMVFQAFDLELQEMVALKVFIPPASGGQQLLDFRDELKLTRQLTHPNIVKVFDLNEHEGFKFLTMELLEGSDLKKHVATSLPIERGLELLTQACAGLQAAHEAGVVHRDVKPQNLFVVKGGPLKVMDFGIARRTSAPGIHTGIIAGTPDYLAPEQIEHFDAVGPSADIYSLGVVAFEIFTGELPFRSSDIRELIRRHREVRAPVASTVKPGLPPELDALIARLLEKSPARRPQSCRELMAALEPIRRRFAFDFL
ncbi:MAG: serine/threonine protein kinase, partial [Myxococcaceae bacterium]|nr:serine/threonine protein kinase [Myxococcaceae bacterium]